MPKIEGDSMSRLRSFLDDIQTHIRALQALGEPVEHWDTIINYLISTKLDTETRKAWESYSTAITDITYSNMIEFIEQKCRILEACDDESSHKTHKFNKNKPLHAKTAYLTPNANKNVKCTFCKGYHLITACEEFLKLSVPSRINKARETYRCLNCLRFGHLTAQCKNPMSCKRCAGRHHTLLHLPFLKEADKEATSQEGTAATVRACASNPGEVILATAMVDVMDATGQSFPCRLLLDSGSQINFITQALAHALGLKQHKNKVSFTGVNQGSSTSSHMVQTMIKSKFNSYQRVLQFLVIKKITGQLPTRGIDLTDWKLPEHLKLADPQFNVPSEINALVGAEIFFDLMCIGQFRIANDLPILQKTSLGWIVTESINDTSSQDGNGSCNLSIQSNVDDLLQGFWKLEEYEMKPRLSMQEQACEENYMKTFQRKQDGRFIVQLPFLQDPQMLGDSKEQAITRFKRLERRLEKDKILKVNYTNFLNDYLAQDHMELVRNPVKSKATYYIPHHPVFKEDSSTTKLRVVFDASAPTSNGTSLNQILMIGPTIQRDLFSIIISFRIHKYVFAADIKQMYRQVLLDLTQTDCQRILWREDRNEEIAIYRLKTVTYGVAAASFLAIRTLHQLIQEEKEDFPLAAKVASRDFYVDDVITGADTPELTLQIQQQLIHMLERGGFQLRKWCANDSSLLANIPQEDIDSQFMINDETNANTIKTLGVSWQPKDDTFRIKVNSTVNVEQVNKRTILADIARLFDPLGLVSPVVFRAKMIMQQLWSLGVSWDEAVPHRIYSAWMEYKEQLATLNELTIRRRAIEGKYTKNIQLHGFSDASEHGYGACLYLRTEDVNGNIFVHLLCAKSRLAPLKTITIPRLELCGALLLSRLMHKTIEALETIKLQEIYLWTDSTIVLHWLASAPNCWQTFVANRVAEIQATTENYEWRHVNSNDNPADILSRGASTVQLMDSHLWWQGPDWLKHEEKTWPEKFNLNDTPLKNVNFERRKIKSTFHAIKEEPNELISKYSCWHKLLRISSYCKRFIINTRLPASERKIEALALEEIEQAEIVWIKCAQQQFFFDEIKDLEKKGAVKPNSKLRSLHPFLDDNNIIRVGGRLRNSALNFDHKFPMVLPAEHQITTMIARYEHVRTAHAGPQALLNKIRMRYWPIKGKCLAQRIVRQCVKCFRVRPKNAEQLMGDLPQYRVQPSRPFINSGVDYCGPIYVRRIQQRKAAPIKTYIALFICMATKAIHIELVTDLTTTAFIAALQRFMARRGKCENIFSDNATNFVGAKRELLDLQKLFKTTKHQDSVAAALAEDGVKWHFIPPRSPHFGGLWEAGVKTVKTHLKRILGNALLTFEEQHTLLCQVEACVNSRPLTPLTSDPNELEPLTPGHFLIGAPLTKMAEPDLTQLPENRLKRWQRVQQLFQHFWRRWSNEYLSTLQQRQRWSRPRKELQPGDLVLIRDNAAPPLKWETGRILEVHPGADRVVRVASLRTAKGVFKRAVNNLYPLPGNDGCMG